MVHGVARVSGMIAIAKFSNETQEFFLPISARRDGGRKCKTRNFCIIEVLACKMN